jgi:hypothetical protein
MADDEPVLREYEVEVRPGVTTTMQLNDADAERYGVKKQPTNRQQQADEPESKSRSASNKARGAENK